ncbi:MAG: Gmad2 immunoglobulin-like domain-containing protein [Candidatus Komeilibacteria bacterium]
MESYPRQCSDGTTTFTEVIDLALEDDQLIILDIPQPESIISSPLLLSGRARGTWFFEATFPVILTDWDGLIIAQGYATAQDDWMTEDFVPFTAELEFTKPEYGERGALILQKDNPSGLPEYDDALEITIYFE